MYLKNWVKSEKSLGFIYCLKDDVTNAFTLCIQNEGKIPDDQIDNVATLIQSAPELLHNVKELLSELRFHGYKNSKTIYDAEKLVESLSFKKKIKTKYRL